MNIYNTQSNYPYIVIDFKCRLLYPILVHLTRLQQFSQSLSKRRVPGVASVGCDSVAVKITVHLILLTCPRSRIDRSGV